MENNEIIYYEDDIVKITDNGTTTAILSKNKKVSPAVHVGKQLQQQKAENEELRKKLGKPYVRRFDLENNKLKTENTQLKQQLEEKDNQIKSLSDADIEWSKKCVSLNRQLELAEKALSYYEIGMHIAGGGSLIEDGTTAKQALSQMQKVGETTNDK